jgi:PPIC-type PPIASE domain
MHKSWLLCVFLGTLAWGQAQPGTPVQPSAAPAGPVQATPGPQVTGGRLPSPAQPPSDAGKPGAPPAPEVPLNAVVLTIKGVCPAVPKTAAASKTAAGKTAAPAKKPADCKTEITRAEFEKIANGLSASVTPQLKRQLEQALPKFMALSEAAKAKGLEKNPRYVETLKIAKMQILTQELQRTVQEEADKVPDAVIADYYKKNPEAYQQFSLDRLFIPRYKQAQAEDKDEAKEPEKPTEEQQKAKEAADKAKQEQGEQELNKLADGLRERAAAGEDFVTLQKEAFAAAGTKVEKPNVNLPKVRRTGLPPAHVAVFDLKVGEVSAVISDNGGHYIYKVVSEEVLPLDQVKEEIHNKLKSERLKEMMDKYTSSFQAVANEAYFGPPAPAGPGGRPPGQMPPHIPRPQMAPPGAQPQGANSGAPQQATPPPSTNAPGQPPAQPQPQQPPPPKPN